MSSTAGLLNRLRRFVQAEADTQKIRHIHTRGLDLNHQNDRPFADLGCRKGTRGQPQLQSFRRMLKDGKFVIRSNSLHYIIFNANIMK